MIRSFLLLYLSLSLPIPGAGQVVPDSAPDRQALVLDSARAEMAKGRSWHAATLLTEAYPDGPGVDSELVLLFARAESGWKNWPGVLALLGESLSEGLLSGSEPWFLLGRALEGMGRWGDAEVAFGRVLALATNEADEGGFSGPGGARAREARARRALIWIRDGRFGEALADGMVLNGEGSSLADWLALRVARGASAAGIPETTHRALTAIRSGEVRKTGWNLLPDALLASGDSTGAEAAFWTALPSLETSRQRASAWLAVGRLRWARGDSTGARGAFHRVLSEVSPGPAGVEAGEGLLALGYDSLSVALAGARALADGGQPQEAIEAFRVYRTLLDAASPGGPVPEAVRLDEARAERAAGRPGPALSVATELSVHEQEAVAVGAFALRMQALRDLGRGGEVRTVEDQFMARFPNRGETVEILFRRAETQRNRGNLEAAFQGYGATVAASSSHDLAGQARMRMAQLREAQGRPEDAVDVYRGYMAEFPRGRRWDEAAFWAGYLLRGMGRDAEAGELFDSLLAQRPLSYYSVRAAELTGAPFLPVDAEAPDSLPLPSAIVSGLARFDELIRVGLVEAAGWEVEALGRTLRADPDPERRRNVVLRLAHELNARGFTREGINLGWDVRREGGAMDRHLLAAIYPFPYQGILEAEAVARRADPYLLAGLIRQESAFWVEARSRADARGLMQVLPATGRELARAQGPSGFRADDHLYDAEINIHLGTAFFADMRRRFGDDLPIILSAYNAGPTRATRWRRYPEASDMIRFVERIPFAETRGYVKNVTLNRAIYTWLYGSG